MRKDAKALGESIALYANLLANDLADELEAQKKLFFPRKQFIEQKQLALSEDLFNQIKESRKTFSRTSALLKEKMSLLQEAEKKNYQQEFDRSFNRIISFQNDPKAILDHLELLTANTIQEFLGFSLPTLKWIYSVGHNLFEEKKYEEAFLIFSLLVFLNGLVPDYRIALGFTQLKLEKQTDALYSFSMASILNPDLATARYNSVKIYLDLKKFDDALIELEILEKIILSQKLSTLQPAIEELKMKIQNKQS